MYKNIIRLDSGLFRFSYNIINIGILTNIFYYYYYYLNFVNYIMYSIISTISIFEDILRINIIDYNYIYILAMKISEYII